MQGYIVRRLLSAALILLLLSVAAFVLLRINAPVDPALMRLGSDASDEQLEAERDRLGLNDPLPVQYIDWGRRLLSFDLGRSSFNNDPVAKNIRNRLPVSLELLALTMALTVLIGVPAGIISAYFRNSALDYGVRVSAIFGLSVPAFWLATLVLLVPNELWGYAPPIGRTVSIASDPIENLRQFGPPAFVLSIPAAAAVMRLARSTLLEVLGQDFVRTARAKGLRERIVLGRHALKNALIPVVTVLGIQFTTLLGGAVIIEYIFTLNGMGRYFFESIYRSDFEVVQTLTVYIGAIVVLTNLAVDLTYLWLDPRIRYE